MPERVGFNISTVRLFYTRQVVYRRDLHHATRLWQLANTVVAEVPDTLRPSLFPGNTAVAEVDAPLLEHGLVNGESSVLLGPGSTWATKRWPSFPELAAELVKHPTLGAHRIVVTGAAADRELAAAVAAGWPTLADHQ